VPSFANGAHEDMRNLVLWKWGLTLPHQVITYGPHGHLPKDLGDQARPLPWQQLFGTLRLPDMTGKFWSNVTPSVTQEHF